MPSLSVIIPVYNTALYLDECLESVLNQDYPDIEVICVDDGSDDESPAILERWQAKDPRVRVIRQEHKGPSAARNTALELVSGDFITFVDADDKVSGTIYSETMPIMDNRSLDVMIFSFRTFPNKDEFSLSIPLDQVMSYQELFHSSRRLQSSNSLCFCWRFLINSSIIKDNRLSFDEQILIGEDMVFNIEVLCHCDSIMAVDRPLYLHRTDNADSLMTMRFNPNLESSFSRMYEVKKRQISSYGLADGNDYLEDLQEYSILIYLRKFISNAFNNPAKGNMKKTVKHILELDMIREAFKAIGFRNIYPTWKEYLFYLAQKFKIMPVVMRVYSRIYGAGK